MRHRISGRKFNRRTSQRKALFNGLAKSLLKYEQIITTLPKAKDLRPYVEKMITLGKTDSVAKRRNLFARLRDNTLVTKVFGELAERYANRQGGYTRIVKCGYRQGDMAPMAVIELVDRNPAAKDPNKPASVGQEAEAELTDVPDIEEVVTEDKTEVVEEAIEVEAKEESSEKK